MCFDKVFTDHGSTEKPSESVEVGHYIRSQVPHQTIQSEYTSDLDLQRTLGVPDDIGHSLSSFISRNPVFALELNASRM